MTPVIRLFQPGVDAVRASLRPFLLIQGLAVAFLCGLSRWCFWIPVNAATYSLPVRIQFILFLCAQGAWSLLLITLTGRDSLEPGIA